MKIKPYSICQNLILTPNFIFDLNILMRTAVARTLRSKTYRSRPADLEVDNGLVSPYSTLRIYTLGTLNIKMICILNFSVECANCFDTPKYRVIVL